MFNKVSLPLFFYREYKFANYFHAREKMAVIFIKILNGSNIK